MKKLLCVALILMLLFPACSFADPEIDFYCGYAHTEIRKDGTPVMYMIYFSEDHTCYFLVQSFNTDGPGFGRSYVGVWEYLSGGDIYAQTGDNTGITFRIIESLGSLVDKSTMQSYHPFSALFD